MMKKTLIASALLAASTGALAEISGNVALTSDYVFRGISQTDNQMAIQGGLDYAHESGLYVGTWASNVDPDFFNGTGHDPQIELDLYFGYAGELASGVGYDLGYLRYEYPGFGTADTNEIYAKASFGDFNASINYSDELAFLASSESAWYIAAGYDTTLPWYGIGFSAHIGYSFGDAFDVPDAFETATYFGYNDSYTDWSLGVSKSWMGVDLGLTYTDVSIDSLDCNTNICDGKVVFSVSKSL